LSTSTEVPNFSVPPNSSQGSMDNYIDCSVCHTPRFRQENFLNIPLSIHGVSSVEEALFRFTESELLDLGNQYYCDTCKTKTDALKGIKFVELPFLLNLQLKRFELDFETFQNVKLGNKVSFPMHLNIGEGYDLCSVVVTYGGLNSGCLWLCAKDLENEKWYKFDDNRYGNNVGMRVILCRVTSMEEKDLEKYYGSEDANRGAPVAYLLVYRRVSGCAQKTVGIEEIPPDVADMVRKGINHSIYGNKTENEEYLKKL
jgi:hypothetical protein